MGVVYWGVTAQLLLPQCCERSMATKLQNHIQLKAEHKLEKEKDDAERASFGTGFQIMVTATGNADGGPLASVTQPNGHCRSAERGELVHQQILLWQTYDTFMQWRLEDLEWPALCLVSSVTSPFICIRFRNRFRNPCPHCRSVSIPWRERIRKNRTRSYFKWWTETANFRKQRTLFLRKLYTTTKFLRNSDKRNSCIFLKRITEIRLVMNGNVMLENRHYSVQNHLFAVSAELSTTKRRSFQISVQLWAVVSSSSLLPLITSSDYFIQIIRPTIAVKNL